MYSLPSLLFRSRLPSNSPRILIFIVESYFSLGCRQEIQILGTICGKECKHWPFLATSIHLIQFSLKENVVCILRNKVKSCWKMSCEVKSLSFSSNSCSLIMAKWIWSNLWFWFFLSVCPCLQRAMPMRLLTVGKKRSRGTQLLVEEYKEKLGYYCDFEDTLIRSNPKLTR